MSSNQVEFKCIDRNNLFLSLGHISDRGSDTQARGATEGKGQLQN